MNLSIEKERLNNQLNYNKDDLFILQTSKDNKTNEDDDDDILILTTTNNDKQVKPETLLTKTVQQLFGKSSSSISCSSIKSNQIINKDEKLILDENNTDEQLIDLN